MGLLRADVIAVRDEVGHFHTVHFDELQQLKYDSDVKTRALAWYYFNQMENWNDDEAGDIFTLADIYETIIELRKYYTDLR